MKKNKFLFVNKSASSEKLTRSLGAQRSAIQRHVQNGLPRPRRSKAQTAKEPLLVDDLALYNPTIRQLSCKLDAFNTASINIDSSVQFLLHYYIFNYQWTIMTNVPLPIHRHPHAFRTSVVPIVHTALEDQLTMYCLLTAAVCRVRHHDRIRYPVSTEDYFMSEALRLLQELIEAANSKTSVARDRLVSGIMFLGIAESFRRNYAAARTHLHALLELLGADGVTQLLDKSVQEQLLLVDLVDSSIYLEPCRFTSIDDPGPATVLSLTEQEINSFAESEPLGCSLLAKDGAMLPAGLKDLVMHILESYNVKTGLKASLVSQSRSFEVTHWVTKRNRAVWKRLLAFVTLERKVQALKAALIMWILLCMTLTARVRTVKEMASNLKSSMDHIPAEEWCRHEDVRLWILMMGYHCAEEESDTFIWFAEQIRRVQSLKRKAIGTMPTPNEGLLTVLVRFQRGFLFHDPVQMPRTERLVEWMTWWDDLISM